MKLNIHLKFYHTASVIANAKEMFIKKRKFIMKVFNESINREKKLSVQREWTHTP